MLLLLLLLGLGIEGSSIEADKEKRLLNQRMATMQRNVDSRPRW